MKTLCAIALAVGLAVPALAAPKPKIGTYAPLHSCPVVLHNYEQGNVEWHKELTWYLGFIEGINVALSINSRDLIGDPVPGMIAFCEQAKSGTLWNAANAVYNYIVEVKAGKATAQ